MANYKYMMYAYVYDFEYGLSDKVFNRIGSNNLAAYDRYKNRQNFRIVIKEGKKVVYDER